MPLCDIMGDAGATKLKEAASYLLQNTIQLLQPFFVMKITSTLLLALLLNTCCFAQTNGNTKFSVQQLKQDLAYLKQQVLQVHANPYTELSKEAYEKLFADIETQLKDSATATEFYKLIKPTVAYLSDEHSQISLSNNQTSEDYLKDSVFLPITLEKKGDTYIINTVLTANSNLQKGAVITHINNVPVAKLLDKCALFTTGFPNQRMEKALQMFGFIYTWINPITHQFNIKILNGKILTLNGTSIKVWQDYLNGKSPAEDEPYTEMISYTLYKDAGYINSRSFSTHNNKEVDSVRHKIEDIFKQVKADQPKYLFIDVSKNGGGNSEIGSILIDHFNNKPYKSYQCNWRRSDEYLKLITSWGIVNETYAAKPVGSILHFDSPQITPSTNNINRFNGKVYIIVGNGTFSSAMMFATIIKDNHLATLAGQASQDGHPTHFGELYGTSLPNTGLKVRFGVKEWIRPAGKTVENILKPDAILNLGKNPTPQEIYNSLIK